MELKELLRNIEVVKFFGVKDRIINDVKNNSREIKLNDLSNSEYFACLDRMNFSKNQVV